jgi:mannosyl-3-phosphoglycerate phosphatase family protein
MMSVVIPTDRSLILFTDLDGTLIDHHTYSAEGAYEALRLLAGHNVPVIFCSSKTFAEQRFIQQQLGIVQPFIVENGSAVVVPPGYFPKPVLDRHGFTTLTDGYEIFHLAHDNVAAIRAVLTDFAEIKGFVDVSDAELGAATGLYGKSLQRARERWFTETILTPLGASEAQELADALSPAGFTLSRGGRFHTVQSKSADKGKAVRWLAGIFRETMPSPILAAVGDSPNDLSMLASVDHAFLVQRHDGTWTDMELPGLQTIEGVGATGFSAAVHLLLRR